MQPVSKKRYFLLAILLAIVILVVYSIGRSILLNFIGANSSNLGLRSNTGITTPSGSMYGFGGVTGESKMIAPTTDTAQVDPSQGMTVPAPQYPPVSGNTPDRKIVKNGNISATVKNIDEAAKQLQGKAEQLGGYIAGSNFNTASDTQNKYGYVQARIPVDKVNEFLSYVHTIAKKVTSESISSDDVTSQYLDVSARIKNLQASEDEYREFMKRATKIEDILSIQRELTSVRGQIEQLQTQQKYLEQTSALSSITVTLAIDESELPIQSQDKWEPGTVFKASVRGLFEMFKNLSYVGIVLAVYAVVWIPVTFALYFLYKYLRRKIR